MKRRQPCGHAFLSAILGVALLPASAAAQSAQASLQGRIVNQASGEPVGGALVIQRNLLTNTQGYRYTNEQGFFAFPALPPGTYAVRADALGFQPEERSPVELPVGSRIELNFDLIRSAGVAGAQPSAPPAPRLGENPRNILAIMYGADAAVPQAVLVRLPVSQVETLIGTVSSLIDENKILELPMSGRDVYTLLVLQPNVSSDNATARGLGFSVNGQQSSSSNFLLDGVDNNDLQVTGPAAKVSADAVKEYRMSTNNFTAEFGRASGTIANAITRSGTNRLHGGLFEFFNHRELNANSFSNNWQHLPKEPFRQNQFGGTLGGPIRRERLFFFGSFEQLRSSTQSQPQDGFLPSAEFVALAAPGSIARKLWEMFPPPAGETLPNAPFVARKVFTYPLRQRNSSALGKVDYSSFDGRQRLSARYAFFQNVQDDFIVSLYSDLNEPLVLRGQNLSLNYTRDLAGGTNEMKFGFNRNSVRVLRPHPEIPTFSSGDGISLPGSESAFDYYFRDTVFHFLNSYSRLQGSHALIAGFEWRPYLHDSLFSMGRDGRYLFGSIFDFLFDSPIALQITINRQTRRPAQDSDFRRYYFHNEGAAFLQDNWKIMPRLTLNLGLRYEYFGAPAARRGSQDYNFVFGPGSNIMERIAGGSIQTGQLFRPDRNNFAPRFGFAFDLTGSGRSVLRGGYGVYFDRIFNNFWMDSRSNNLVLRTFTNIVGPPQFQYTIPASQAVAPVSSVGASFDFAVDQNLRTPYAQSWFVGWQHQVTPDLLLEINQTGSVGKKLAATDIINRIFSLPLSAATPSGRFNPNEPDISFRSNQGFSDHLAFQVVVNRRWSRGMQFQASYTLARTRDVQSDPLGRRAGLKQVDRIKRLAEFGLFVQPEAAFVRQFDPRADYGASDFDQRQNLVFNFTAQIPPQAGLPLAFSGWQASAIAGFRSGFPFTVTALPPELFFLEPGRGILHSNRADYHGNSSGDAFLSQPIPVEGGLILLDAAKFSAPPTSRMGNSRRNAFYGPGFWNVDFSLSRRFLLPRLGEQVSLQFRAELFNAFNHANLGNPENQLGRTDPPFGAAQFGRKEIGANSPAASPLNEQPRRVQLGLKLNF